MVVVSRTCAKSLVDIQSRTGSAQKPTGFSQHNGRRKEEHAYL